MFAIDIMLLLLLFSASFIASTYGDSYKAAVVEFSPEISNLTSNLERFIQLIKDAKAKKSDIIVFPEIGLNGYGPCSDDMLTEVPHPFEKVAPYLSDKGNYSQALKNLSRAAMENSIYLVVNIAEILPCAEKGCPQNGRLRYNTNVVFDRQGFVIARYRKYNLFNEGETTKTADPELAIFDTDFGVRFGTFICFDLLFDRPALQLVKQLGIRDFAFSTAWFSELPFLTAGQAQQMWSYAFDVNLLASGYNDPAVGSGGSGIFRGRDGPLAVVFPDNATTLLITAEVPKTNLSGKSSRMTSQKSFPIKEKMYLKRENLTAYHSSSLDKLKEDPKICHGEFCCQINVNYTVNGSEAFRYRALAFDGVRTFDGAATGGIQACALVICENDTTTGCGFRGYSGILFKDIEITGTFTLENALPMPSTLKDGNQLLPLHSNDFSFVKECDDKVCNITMKLIKPTSNLQTFGIMSRVFSRDGQPASTSGATIHSTLAVVLAVATVTRFIF